MNLNPNSASGATATPAAPAPSAPASSDPGLNPSAVTRTGDSRALPPAPPTNLDGDISFDDFDSPTPAPAQTTPEPAAAQTQAQPQTPPAKPAEPATPDDPLALPASVQKALEKLTPKEPDVAAQQPQTPQTPAQPQGRQYTGIEAVDKVLKKLPNDTFNAVKDLLPKWYEAHEKQAQAPKYLAAHPEAYKLSPQYTEAVTAAQELQSEYSAFEDALVAYKSGQDVKIPEGYIDGKLTFKVIPAAQAKSNTRLELLLQNGFNSTQQAYNRSLQDLGGFKAQHSARVAEEQKFIDTTFQKFFPDIDESKFSPVEQKLKGDFEKMVPDSISPEQARRALYYSFVKYHRLAQAFAASLDKPAVPTLPQRGPAGGAGADDLIKFDEL